MGDADLVRQAMAGRSAAYEQLVRRWAACVTAVCHARVGPADAAEDLAQETLLRGWRALPTLADPDRFGPWLCGIASRTCLDWLKASARTEVSLSTTDEAEDEPSATDPIEQSERREEVGRLIREVERLPPTYREVLMHYYYDDCTYAELGELLGVSAATVNARLTKARAMLRQRLGVGPASVDHRQRQPTNEHGL